MTQREYTEQELNLNLAGMKRNPYLVDYREKRRMQQLEGDRRGTENRKHRNARRRAQIRRQRMLVLVLGVIAVLAVLIFLISTIASIFTPEDVQIPQDNAVSEAAAVIPQEMVQGISVADYCRHPTWTEDFLTPNEYSRPGDSLQEVNDIFVHYTANQGTSAAQNRSYFEQLKDTHERSASAHFIIGYEGEIIQCIPLDEIAYAVQTRNEDSISIECCYLAEDGSFTQETYDSLIQLLQWLVATYDLETEDILRHYDCGGKKCPIYYTEHEDAWEQLKEDVKTL